MDKEAGQGGHRARAKSRRRQVTAARVLKVGNRQRKTRYPYPHLSHVSLLKFRAPPSGMNCPGAGNFPPPIHSILVPCLLILSHHK